MWPGPGGKGYESVEAGAAPGLWKRSGEARTCRLEKQIVPPTSPVCKPWGWPARWPRPWGSPGEQWDVSGLKGSSGRCTEHRAGMWR